MTITGVTVGFAVPSWLACHAVMKDKEPRKTDKRPGSGLRSPEVVECEYRISDPEVCRKCFLLVQGTLRVYMLDLLACMGVQVCKAMPPQTITHVVASNLHDKASKKLEHARNVQ